MQAVIIFLLLSVPFSWVLAVEPSSVVINEIAWMGTKASSADEWIELYNNTNEDIDFEGWGLYEAGGETLIEPLTGAIKGKSYYLIERTDDTTVPNIEASQPPTSWGGHGLNNNGEYLQLLNSNSNVVDEVDCREGWFAGDNETKRTMERKNSLLPGSDSLNWQTSQNAGGTPKAENKSHEVEPREIIYPLNIFINELLPSPEDSDAENEWIELSNGNNFEVVLSGWQIRDTVGATKTYTIPEGTKIDPNSFLLLPRPETKITLQNSGDGLEILNPDGEVVDRMNYPKAPLGQSFNRTLSGWAWSETLTPGETNIIAGPEILKTDSSETFEEKEEGKKALAKIDQELPKSSNPLTIFLIALSMAISSGVIVLFLRKRTASEKL